MVFSCQNAWGYSGQVFARHPGKSGDPVARQLFEGTGFQPSLE
jgi:hypothetical protein